MSFVSYSKYSSSLVIQVLSQLYSCNSFIVASLSICIIIMRNYVHTNNPTVHKSDDDHHHNIIIIHAVDYNSLVSP